MPFVVEVMPLHINPALHDAAGGVTGPVSVRQHGWPIPPHGTQRKEDGSQTPSLHNATMGATHISGQHGSVRSPQLLTATAFDGE